MEDFTEAIFGLIVVVLILLCSSALFGWLYSKGYSAGENKTVKVEIITKASELCNSNGGLSWVNTKEVACANNARFYLK